MTESRVVAIPVVVQPVPVEDNLAAVLVEIGDVEVAVAVLHVMCAMPSMPPPLECSQG